VTDVSIERPRAVSTLRGGAGGDRALAEALCAGTFVHAGERRDFDLDPAWETGRGADAWQRALAAFEWGHDLAHAYRETAESRFLTTWQRLVLSWIARGRVEHDPVALVARRIESWIGAWDGFASAPAFGGLPAGVPRRIVTSLRAQVRHLHRRVAAEPTAFPAEAHAILVAVLAFPHLDTSGALLTFAASTLREHLLHIVLADGVCSAGRLARQAEMLVPLIALGENARRFGLELAPEHEVRLERACDVLLHCHSSIRAGSAPVSDLLARAGTLLQRGDYLWGASQGRRGVAPGRRNLAFTDGGYQVQRSPWGSRPLHEERFCLFDVAPASEPANTLQVQLTACGHTIVAGPGGDVRPAHPMVRLVGRRTAPGLDIIRGHAFDAERDAWHDRHVVFVADEYWIIHDRVRDPDTSRHELCLQLEPTAGGQTTVDVRDGNAVITAPGLSVVVAPGHTPLDIGLVAGGAAGKAPAQLFSVVAEGVPDTEVSTLVIPHAPGQTAPTITVHDGPDATVVEVRGVGPECDAVDWVGWAPRPTLLALGEFRVRAAAAWMRQSGDGRVLAFGASDTGVDAAATTVSRDLLAVQH
jgi:hypothetical protein